MKASSLKNQRVCFIFPAYNEGPVVGTVVDDLKKHLKDAVFDYQIVVVDDGSKDKTAYEAEKHGAYVIRHIINTGTGGATATGLSYAQQNGFTIAATMDADGQHHAEDVLRGVELINKNGSDLLIGSRLLDGSGMSRTKRIGNRGLSFITFLLFGVNTTDSQSGLRIFSKLALDRLKWKTSGYEFCSEMLWRARQQNLAIDEYPIRAIYSEYSKSKGQNNWNAFNIIKSLLRRRMVEFIE